MSSRLMSFEIPITGKVIVKAIVEDSESIESVKSVIAKKILNCEITANEYGIDTRIHIFMDDKQFNKAIEDSIKKHGGNIEDV